MIIRLDPCGLLCVLMIYGSVVYADYVITIWMVMPVFGNSIWGAFHITIFNTLIFMTLFSHGRTMFTDPGVVPILKSNTLHDRSAHFGLLSSSSEDDCSSDREEMMLHSWGGAAADWTMCTRCESFRPPRAHHCRVCRRCIRKMDHHCPWVNNCIGELNQKFFLQFLLYVGLSSMYSMLLHSIFLSMETALFGMFVLAVSCDQLGAIFSEETSVEAVQRGTKHVYKRGRRKGRISLLKEVCGGNSLYAWLIPCSSPPATHDYYTNQRTTNHHIEV
ncbi:DHHC zinc finger domain protein [Dictyocaulus viviparus]|uniref:Palmitoyltransferase n=1 Tax=Dictyocaulus viviparus TaxID=29172 RepID=A0A0D8YFD3_DICVI|nr:DHHC zinc finger domain protein [Dictyocaulus viviparus]